MVSVLTLNKNRTSHLTNLIKGLNRSSKMPDELIIVDMSDNPVKFSSPYFPIKTIHLTSPDLELSKMRNLAANTAKSEKLLFLDVDCIPSYNFVDIMSDILDKYKEPLSVKVIYLPENCIDNEAEFLPTEAVLLQKGASLHRYFNPNKDMIASFESFWTLAFAVRKSIFEEIGGFCEDFKGWGGEDTEFAYRAQTKNIKHRMIGKTKVFHQHHAVGDFPFVHFRSIVANAKTFYDIWGVWIMQEQLNLFKEHGYIDFNEKHSTIEILKYPE